MLPLPVSDEPVSSLSHGGGGAPSLVLWSYGQLATAVAALLSLACLARCTPSTCTPQRPGDASPCGREPTRLRALASRRKQARGRERLALLGWTRSNRAQARHLLQPRACICRRAPAPPKALVSIHHTSVAAPRALGLAHSPRLFGTCYEGLRLKRPRLSVHADETAVRIITEAGIAVHAAGGKAGGLVEAIASRPPPALLTVHVRQWRPPPRPRRLIAQGRGRGHALIAFEVGAAPAGAPVPTGAGRGPGGQRWRA
jgi:hypothetical protein